MRGIPTLMVESSVHGLMQFNMIPAGEIGPDKRVAIPLGADGVSVLHMMPLEAGFLPLTCRLRMKEGRPCPPDEAAGRMLIRSWPGGFVEAALTPERIPRPSRLPLSPVSASRIAFASGGRRLWAEWALFGDWWLAIEDEDGAPLLTHAVPEATEPGPVTMKVMEGRQYVTARAAVGDGLEYVAVAGQSGGRWQVLFSDTGHEIEDAGEVVAISRDLADTAGHRRRRVWRPGAAPDDRITVHGQENGRAPEEIARAFLEALALGLDGEAAAMLSPSLQEGLSIEEIRGFVGEIGEILPCRYGPPAGPGWAVARPAKAGICEVTPYAFTVSEGRIENIAPCSF